MSTVLAQEGIRKPLKEENATIPDNATIPVNVKVIVESREKIWFVEDSAADYTVTRDTITLIGSGGSPREFVITFTLKSNTFWFTNPAVKLFQGGSKKAGIRVAPTSPTTATVALFNILGHGDNKVTDDFSLLVTDGTNSIAHDPTIVWDPPNG